MTRHDCYMIVIRLHGNHTAKLARMQSTERSNLNMKFRINYTERKKQQNSGTLFKGQSRGITVFQQ